MKDIEIKWTHEQWQEMSDIDEELRSLQDEISEIQTEISLVEYLMNNVFVEFYNGTPELVSV